MHSLLKLHVQILLAHRASLFFLGSGALSAIAVAGQFASWWLWLVVGALFLFGLGLWLLPAYSSTLVEKACTQSSKHALRAEVIARTVQTGNPVTPQLQQNATPDMFWQNLPTFETALQSELIQLENSKEHKLTRAHILCVAGLMTVLAAALVAKATSDIKNDLKNLTQRPSAQHSGKNDSPLQPSKSPPALGEIIDKDFPSVVVKPNPANPSEIDVKVQPGSPPPNDEQLVIVDKSVGLETRLQSLKGAVESYDKALDNPEAATSTLVEQRDKLLSEASALAKDYKALAQQAKEAGMPMHEKRLNESAEKVEAIAKSAGEKTHPEKTTPGERKDQDWQKDVTEFLEWLKKILGLFKEVMDLLDKLFGEDSGEPGEPGEPGENNPSKLGPLTTPQTPRTVRIVPSVNGDTSKTPTGHSNPTPVSNPGKVETLPATRGKNLPPE